MKQSVNLELGELAVDALAEAPHRTVESDSVVPTRAVRAIRYYLADENAGRGDWRYPGFLSKGDGNGVHRHLEVEIDTDVWARFAREAESQEVPVQRLAEHAVLYFLADRDAGRVTQRILDDLDDA